MRVQQLLCLICAVVMVMPVVTYAQVYKWKDKQGNVQYTDTPPPTNVKTETIGKKKPERLPVGNVEKPTTETVKKAQEQIKQGNFEEAVNPEEVAAKLRQRNAEIEKKKKIEQEERAKADLENCKSARANYQTYALGGRVYKTNENGEREYMSDSDLNASKQKAQNEINQYCK